MSNITQAPFIRFPFNLRKYLCSPAVSVACKCNSLVLLVLFTHINPFIAPVWLSFSLSWQLFVYCCCKVLQKNKRGKTEQHLSAQTVGPACIHLIWKTRSDSRLLNFQLAWSLILGTNVDFYAFVTQFLWPRHTAQHLAKTAEGKIIVRNI